MEVVERTVLESGVLGRRDSVHGTGEVVPEAER